MSGERLCVDQLKLAKLAAIEAGHRAQPERGDIRAAAARPVSALAPGGLAGIAPPGYQVGERARVFIGRHPQVKAGRL